jgi:hypothetical protein
MGLGKREGRLPKGAGPFLIACRRVSEAAAAQAETAAKAAAAKATTEAAKF